MQAPTSRGNGDLLVTPQGVVKIDLKRLAWDSEVRVIFGFWGLAFMGFWIN